MQVWACVALQREMTAKRALSAFFGSAATPFMPEIRVPFTSLESLTRQAVLTTPLWLSPSNILTFVKLVVD